MPTIIQLVDEYSKRIRPISKGFTCEMYTSMCRSFREEASSLSNVTEEIGAGLESLRVKPEAFHTEFWLNAADIHPSTKYVPVLCALLSLRDRYVQHEWIANLLGKIKSEDAIDALRDCCSFVVSGDPARQLACCCLDALCQIGGPKAKAAIRSQLLSDSPEVREFAREALEKFE